MVIKKIIYIGCIFYSMYLHLKLFFLFFIFKILFLYRFQIWVGYSDWRTDKGFLYKIYCWTCFCLSPVRWCVYLFKIILLFVVVLFHLCFYMFTLYNSELVYCWCKKCIYLSLMLDCKKWFTLRCIL